LKEFKTTLYLSANHKIDYLIKGESEKEMSKYAARKLFEKKIWIIDGNRGICSNILRFMS
jgi:hypothetical protein